MLRWGILSSAKIAREKVMPAMVMAPNATIAAIASREETRAQTVAEAFSIPHAFGSYDELLRSDAVDAVYIPLPTAQHVEWTIKAAEAGKHVLCEKPIAMQATEIDRIQAAADASNVIVSEAFMVFYHPQWRKIRQLIAEGAIGKLIHIQASFSYHNMDANNMRNRVELGGGGLRDIGCYIMMTSQYATGVDPVRVDARIDYDPDFATDRFAAGRVDFGEFEMDFYVGTQMAHRQTIVFHGTDGFIEVAAPFNAGLYDGDKVFLHDRNRSETRCFRYPGVNQYALQIEAFGQRVLAGEGELFSLQSSKMNQRVIDALFRSGESREWERV